MKYFILLFQILMPGRIQAIHWRIHNRLKKGAQGYIIVFSLVNPEHTHQMMNYIHRLKEQ